MSGLRTVNFNSLIFQRLELRESLKIEGFTDKLSVLAQFILASNTLANNSEKIDQILSLLMASARKNKDFETIYKVEQMSAEILRTIKNNEVSK